MPTAYQQLCFTMRESPHRIEISEGEPYEAAEGLPSHVGIVYEVAPMSAGGLQLHEIDISETDVGEAEALAGEMIAG